MTDGNESPEENRLAVIAGDEPITRATAIVSPIARPRPSMTAPTMPPIECGSTAPVIISHRVAPSANAPSRSVCGVVSMTSRAIDVMIGVIITDRIRPAVMNVRPALAWPKMSPRTGQPWNQPLTIL